MARRPRGEKVDGWVILDKPVGLGSTLAVGKVRRLFGAQKAGHGGTLDPLASGVLPIALGEATKTVPFVMDGAKEYRFTLRFGEARSTEDAEGEVTAVSDVRPTDDAIRSALPAFLGEIEQVPPAFSALKIEGRRAYDLARAGETVDLAPRRVRIERLELLGRPDLDHADFVVGCGKGTYIRSLARDMGRALGCLGHVSRLRRVAVGPFAEAHMISLEKLEEFSHRAPSENSLWTFLRPIETVLDGIPALAVLEPEAKRLKQGQRVWLPEAQALGETEAVLITHDGRPLGLFRIENGVLKAIRMFNLDARS